MELLFLEPQVLTQIKADENIMLTVVIRLIGLLMLYRMNVEQNVNRKVDATGFQVALNLFKMSSSKLTCTALCKIIKNYFFKPVP